MIKNLSQRKARLENLLRTWHMRLRLLQCVWQVIGDSWHQSTSTGVQTPSLAFSAFLIPPSQACHLPSNKIKWAWAHRRKKSILQPRVLGDLPKFPRPDGSLLRFVFAKIFWAIHVPQEQLRVGGKLSAFTSAFCYWLTYYAHWMLIVSLVLWMPVYRTGMIVRSLQLRSTSTAEKSSQSPVLDCSRKRSSDESKSSTSPAIRHQLTDTS